MTQPTTSELSHKSVSLSRLLHINPQYVISSLTAGLVIGTIGVIRAISYATLIFAGPLSDQIPVGIGMAVLSTGVIGIVVALLSAYPGMIATPLAAPTVLLAVLADQIARTLAAQQAPPETVLVTVLAAIALVSVVTGILFLVLGLAKQGDRICVVPYPVVGGFMAGTGWLLVQGFVQITTDRSLTFETLPELLQSHELICWLPGVGFALVLLAASRQIQHYLVIPTVLLLATGFFYLMIGASHISLSDAQAAGLFLGPFPEGSGGMWHPLSLGAMGDVQWSVLEGQAGNLLTVSLVTLLSLVLSNNAIELAVSRDIGLNRELVAVGFANIGSGLMSGMVGTQALPSTVLAQDMQAPHRLTGVMTLIPVAAVLALGASFLGYLPQAVLGSLILYLGLSLFTQWLVESWSTLPLESYLIIVVMVITVARFGFLEGIGIGILITVFHFAFAYSRLAVVKSTFSGGMTRSNAQRPTQQQQVLAEQGDRIYGMELQGFMFFGTAPNVLRQVCQRALQSSDNDRSNSTLDLDYLVLDFRQVTGLDSSAVATMGKILKLAKKQNFRLLYTNLSSTFQERLVRGKSFEMGDICHVFPDIDRALEWAEDKLLRDSDQGCYTHLPDEVNSLHLPDPFQEMLTADQLQQFTTYLEPLQLPEKHIILKAGGSNSGLYFINSGQVSVLLDLADGSTKRLQTCTRGQILGEMRFFGKTPLSSRVVTDTETNLLYLSPSAFTTMKQDCPALAHALQEFIVKVLCDSLIRREEQLRVTQ